jgi:AcrR family transcriptional regulator
MARADRRVRRTRQALARALLDLAATRPFAQITVRELTEHADVGYATFFRHFPSKEALLLDVLRGVVNDLARLLQPITDAGRLDEAGRALFDYVAANARPLRVLFAAQRSGTLERQLRHEVLTRVSASASFRPPAGIPPEVAAHHLAVASLALVGWWLEHDMPHDVATMGRVYAQLVVRPILDDGRANGGGRDAPPRDERHAPTGPPRSRGR